MLRVRRVADPALSLKLGVLIFAVNTLCCTLYAVF